MAKTRYAHRFFVTKYNERFYCRGKDHNFEMASETGFENYKRAEMSLERLHLLEIRGVSLSWYRDLAGANYLCWELAQTRQSVAKRTVQTRLLLQQATPNQELLIKNKLISCLLQSFYL
jgi:hypothetical protein